MTTNMNLTLKDSLICFILKQQSQISFTSLWHFTGVLNKTGVPAFVHDMFRRSVGCNKRKTFGLECESTHGEQSQYRVET